MALTAAEIAADVTIAWIAAMAQIGSAGSYQQLTADQIAAFYDRLYKQLLASRSQSA